MRFVVKHESRTPLSDQVEEGLRSRLHGPELRAGTRLPSIRQLALDLGVSRNTVIEAYDRLVAQGLVRSRQGSGYFVGAQSAGVRNTTGVSNPQDAEDVTDALWHLFSEQDDSVKLGCGWLPESWREADDMAYAIRQVTRSDRQSLFDYSTPLGGTGLRAGLQRRLHAVGIESAMSQILLTTGASHALDLLIRLLLRPGDLVFVESPGYYNLFGLLKLQGVHMVGVPRTPNGPDTEELERLLATHRPKLFFVNGIFQNPTGTVISASVAHRVLQLADRFDFRVVEDDIYADFQTEATVRLAALDQMRRVIYIGSFSKSLSCSLRVGFIVASVDLIRRLVDVKMLTSIASSRFAEEVLTVMFENGSYHKVVQRLRRRLDRQVADSLRLVESSGWQVYTHPIGGMFLWVRRPEVEDASLLVESAARRGVRLSVGAVFTPDMTPSPWLRINVAYVDEPRAQAFLTNPLASEQSAA